MLFWICFRVIHPTSALLISAYLLAVIDRQPAFARALLSLQCPLGLLARGMFSPVKRPRSYNVFWIVWPDPPTAAV